METSEERLNPKTCITCKHLLGKRSSIENWKEKWRCEHPANVKGKDIHTVTGESITSYKEINIFQVRNEMVPSFGVICGGNKWEEYIHPSPAPTIGGQTGTDFTETFDAADLSVARSAAQDRIAKLKNKKLSSNDLGNL